MSGLLAADDSLDRDVAARVQQAPEPAICADVRIRSSAPPIEPMGEPNALHATD